MASISEEKGGRKTVQFVAPDGRRKSIRLGKANRRQAQVAALHIEELLTAKSTGGRLNPATAEWVSQVPETMRRRLERAELIAPRERKECPRLVEWIDRYIVSRTDIKPRTLINYHDTRRRLVKFFGETRRLDEVTAGDAEDFRVHLKAKGLAEGTVRRVCKRCRQFFTAAIKRKIIFENPFADIQCGHYANAERFHFVTAAEAQAVLEACPDAESRLIFALCRYGALRCPSEVLALRWSDIDWERMRFTVRAAKTEHHVGGGLRQVPIFPELAPHLQDCFDLAEPGTEFVISRYRDTSVNLRTGLSRIITRARLTPWPKLFVNLRSTRVTELCETFPSHVVAAWAGHSEQIARKHYLQTTETHFQKAVQNPVQCGSESDGMDGQADGENPPYKQKRPLAVACETAGGRELPPRGFEATKTTISAC